MFNADSRAVGLVLELLRLEREDHVAEWPEEDREFFRNGDWNSFSDRREQIDLMRARRLLTALTLLEPENRASVVSDRIVLVAVPAVPYGPEGVDPDEADATYYREAARNIRFQAENGDAFAGSNLTETVARLCEATAEALHLNVLRRERGSFFPYAPEACPLRTQHRQPTGPNEDASVCSLCGTPTWTMRPDGESFGWHAPDCSLPLRHPGPCEPGGRGHEVPEGWTIRG